MFDFILREDIQTKMIALTAINCAIFCYQCWKKKDNYSKKIQQVQKAPIYEFGQFIQIQKHKNKNSLFVLGKEELDIGNDGFYLVKMKSKGQPFTTHQQKIYSNQIQFCPPSMNLALQKALKEYQKSSQPNRISLDSLTKNKYSLFKGIILTDKISYTNSYKPNPQIQINLNQDFIFTFWDFLSWCGSKFYQNISSLAQALMQILNFKKNQKRSRNPNRVPLFKGIFAGILTSQFSLLANTTFLLKVNIEGKQFSTQLIADNKLMMMEFYSSQIKKQNLHILIALTAAIGGFSFFIYKFKPRLQILLRSLTKKKTKKINPQRLTDNKICQICYVNCRNIVFFKCRHLVVCEQCFSYANQVKCMICNQILEETKVIVPL